MKRLVVAGIVLVCGILAGCSSKTAAPSTQSAAGPSGVDVGSVVVVLGDSISADARKIVDEVNGVARLKTAIDGELGKAGRLKTGSTRVLEIKVSEFRLRSGATVFWAGIMSGVDTLQVHAVVREGSRTVREFDTGDSTSGAFAGLSSSSRFQTMTDAVAERVKKEL